MNLVPQPSLLGLKQREWQRWSHGWVYLIFRSIPNRLVHVLLQGLGGFRVVQGFTPLLVGQLLLVLEDGVSDALVLHLQETPGTLALLLCQLAEAVAQAF